MGSSGEEMEKRTWIYDGHIYIGRGGENHRFLLQNSEEGEE
jgi:hypothetical protein